MAPKRKARIPYNYSEATLNNRIPCPTCGKSFKQQGFKSHERSCRNRKKEAIYRARAQRRYERELMREIQSHGEWGSQLEAGPSVEPVDGGFAHEGPSHSPATSADDQQQLHVKVECPPRSDRPARLQTLDAPPVRPPSDLAAPWHPFRCQGDLEFAEIVRDASLDKGHVDALLKLIARVAGGQARVTFENEAALRKACDGTSAAPGTVRQT